MTQRDFLAQIEELVEAPPGSLKGPEPLSGLERWDSLAVVGFIAMVDEKLELTLSAKKIAAAKTVNELVALVGDRLSRDAA